MAFTDGHNNAEHDVYEVRLDITHSGYSGPDKVTGVVAALTSSGVQITWNAEKSETGILNYQVFRAPHGAGYPLSVLQATIAPTGASTYTWTDTAVHDSSFNYWVIASNPTGFSPPSDLAALTSASSAVYSTGVNVEALKPTEVGADATANHTSATSGAFPSADTLSVDGASITVGTLTLQSSGTHDVFMFWIVPIYAGGTANVAVNVDGTGNYGHGGAASGDMIIGAVSSLATGTHTMNIVAQGEIGTTVTFSSGQSYATLLQISGSTGGFNIAPMSLGGHVLVRPAFV
jgi:hypothetical protein